MLAWAEIASLLLFSSLSIHIAMSSSAKMMITYFDKTTSTLAVRNAAIHNILRNIFHIFLFISFQQGLCDLHANSGAALPDVPSCHHVFMLRFHLQTLQENPSLQGKCAIIFSKSLLNGCSTIFCFVVFHLTFFFFFFGISTQVFVCAT